MTMLVLFGGLLLLVVIGWLVVSAVIRLGDQMGDLVDHSFDDD